MKLLVHTCLFFIKEKFIFQIKYTNQLFVISAGIFLDSTLIQLTILLDKLYTAHSCHSLKFEYDFIAVCEMYIYSFFSPLFKQYTS